MGSQKSQTQLSHFHFTKIITVSEVRKRMTNSIWYHLYVEFKIWRKQTYLQIRNILTDIESRLALAKGKGYSGENYWELGISRGKGLHAGWMNSKLLLCSTGNHTQCLVMNNKGKECFWKRMYVYYWVTLLYSRNWHYTVNQLYVNKILSHKNSYPIFHGN